MRYRLGTMIGRDKNVANAMEREMKIFQKQVKRHPGIVTELYNKEKPLFMSAANCMYEGAYIIHLRRLLHRVGRENVRIYWTDDFLSNPSGVVRDALKFVGADPDIDSFNLEDVTAIKYNALPKRQQETKDPNLFFPAQLRDEMERTMRPFNNQLLEFFGEAPPWMRPSEETFQRGSFETFSSAGDLFANDRISQQGVKDMIVIFVDTGYLEPFGVWLDFYKRHDNLKRILCIFAVSQESYNTMKHTFSLPSNQEHLAHIGDLFLVNLSSDITFNRLDKLWVLRMRMMRQILEAFPGSNVIFSDSDALWVRDPVHLFHQHGMSDIIASRGTYPNECPLGTEDTGVSATICLGFTFFRYSPAVLQLAGDVVNKISKYKDDDQMAMNCVLNELYKPGGNHESSSSVGVDPILRSFSRNNQKGNQEQDLVVTLLPYHEVTRYCDGTDLRDAYVVHCFTPKDGSSKMESFSRYGFLVENGIKFH